MRHCRATYQALICLFIFGISYEGRQVFADAADPAELSARVKEFLRQRCFECHGGSKTQGGVKVLDHALLIGERQVVIPREPDNSLMYQVLTANDESVMPPAGQPRPTSDEIDMVRRWIVAGAPPFPADVKNPAAATPNAAGVVGTEYVLTKIADHVRSQPAEKRPYLRYFSTNHLLAGGATQDELTLQREALCKVINHLSWKQQIAKLKEIEPTNTVFTLDIRDVGWNQQPFEQIVDGKPNVRSKLNLYDLILLEYPYSLIYEDSDAWRQLGEGYMATAALVRPIPFLRADWFTSIVALPSLYEDMLQLPHEISELESKLGVDSAANLRDVTVQRAGMTVSGVSRNNRVVERHSSNYGAYWKSFDYSSNRGHENMFHDPINLSPVGGEMVFSLPNGLNGYFVTDAVGKRIELAPTSIVTDKFAEDKTVRNGLSCIRCHENGIKGFTDNVRSAVEAAPGSPGFDKRLALRLYVPNDDMQKLVAEDTLRFKKAMEQVVGHVQTREPVIPVSRRFIDAPLSLHGTAGELGLASTDGLTSIFRAPHFSGLGLLPLASQGIIRRDTWEDYYDQVVRGLGLGVPVIPLDGLGRGDYPAGNPPLNVTISTNRSNNIFSPNDELVVFVTNRSNSDVNVELIGTSALGRKVILLPSSTVLSPGQQFRFPKTGTIKIQPALGRELLTVFASTEAFEPGVILRGKDIADRIVHPFFALNRNDGTVKPGFDAGKFTKRTIAIETR
jgi:serine/threonine-protein kinase